MRAKTINEITQFERGISPKAAMGVGGVKLEDAWNNIMITAVSKWEKFLISSLINKKISGKFLKFNGKTWTETPLITFKVKEIVNWETDGDINVKDEEGNTYAIKLDQKIHIG